jgi:MADS-box transcription factor
MNYMPTRYSQHPDQHFMRPMHNQYQQHHPVYPPMMTSQQHPNDVFPTYLDTDPRQHTAGQGFIPIDWPVHAPAQDGRPTHSQSDPNDASWLDFLSGNPAHPSVQASSSSLPPSARDNISWERDWPAPTKAAVASRSPSRPSSTASDIAAHNANPHKRSRVESDASGGFANEQGKDIEVKLTASSAKAIKKKGDVKGQVLELDRKADGEE